MKIVIAPDSYKGSLSAVEVGQTIAAGVRLVFPQAETIVVPLADGGEGTVGALISATGGQIISQMVTGPLGESTVAQFGILGDGKTAVIEMASASGLPLVPEGKRNPMFTTTYGTGELILAALDKGCRQFIIGLGGSATNDGGAGMAQALGAKLLDKEGREIAFGAAGLARLERIDITSLDQRLGDVEISVACDVNNPLTGPRGAARIFGPQKGANLQMVEKLETLLCRFAQIVRRDLGRDIEDIPGAGAAGGLGAGLLAFLPAHLLPGVEIVLEAVGLEEELRQGADLVITGEGEINRQTLYGKVPMGVAQRAKKYKIPVIAVVGGIGGGVEELYNAGIDSIITIVGGPISLQNAVENAAELMVDSVVRAMRLIKLGMEFSAD